MSKILIVEDERDLASELKVWFKREKYVVELAHTRQRCYGPIKCIPLRHHPSRLDASWYGWSYNMQNLS